MICAPYAGPATRAHSSQIAKCALWIALSLVPCLASAQESASAYPSKPVAIINPNAPGGSLDKDIRLYAQKLTENLGKPFVMDFKVGAGSTIGTNYVARDRKSTRLNSSHT